MQETMNLFLSSSFSLLSLLPLLLLTLLLSTYTSYIHAQSSNTTTTSSSTASIPIVVKGNKLYNSVDNSRFYINGIAYGYYVEDQYQDKWLPALQALHRDAPNINTIRFYTITSNGSYDRFMQETAKLGIYVVVPLTISEPSWCVLDRSGVPNPVWNGTWTTKPQCYPSCLLSEAQKVINKFNSYPNTLSYIIGNEVINSRAAWQAAPCVKQFTADIKTYFKQCGIRQVPLMYTAADNAIPEQEDINRIDGRTGVLITAEENDRMKLDFLAGCGTLDQQIDIFGINTYRYCVSNRDYYQSNYNKLTDAFKGSAIPVILGEFGCTPFYYKNGTFNPSDVTDTANPGIQGQRDWKDLLWIEGPEMNDVMSGGIAYEYGARGGHSFELYADGSLDPAGNVPTTKACGYGGCGIDNLNNKLTQAMAYTKNLSQYYQPTQVDPTTNTAVNTTRTCRSSLWTDIDLSAIPSRYVFGGYINVSCPAYSATAK